MDTEKLVSAVKQIVALVAVNIFGFAFDAGYIYAAIAIDVLVLGYDLKTISGSKA